jgi:hypothetical protein
MAVPASLTCHQALKDNFPRARCAGLSSLSALADSIPAEVAISVFLLMGFILTLLLHVDSVASY